MVVIRSLMTRKKKKEKKNIQAVVSCSFTLKDNQEALYECVRSVNAHTLKRE